MYIYNIYYINTYSLTRSRSVLSEMLTSLEKSKNNFGKIEEFVTKTLPSNDYSLQEKKKQQSKVCYSYSLYLYYNNNYNDNNNDNNHIRNLVEVEENN